MTSYVLISDTAHLGLSVKLRNIGPPDGKDWRGGHVSQAPANMGNVWVYRSDELTGAAHFASVIASLGLEIIE